MSVNTNFELQPMLGFVRTSTGAECNPEVQLLLSWVVLSPQGLTIKWFYPEGAVVPATVKTWCTFILWEHCAVPRASHSQHHCAVSFVVVSLREGLQCVPEAQEVEIH